MEAALLVAIEVIKNDFLCTTFGLVFIGCNMIFSGFYRQPSASPVWISWMCAIAPFRVRTVTSITIMLRGAEDPIAFTVGIRWVCIPNIPLPNFHCVWNIFPDADNLRRCYSGHLFQHPGYARMGTLRRCVQLRRALPLMPVLVVRMADGQAAIPEPRVT